MAAFKVTFLFNWGRYGWSETWYKQGVDYTTVIGDAAAVGARRIKLLGKNALLEMTRVSQEEVFSDSKIEVWPRNQGTYEASADTPWNSWLARIEATPLYRRSFHIRGVPDMWISYAAGEYHVDPVPVALENAFYNWWTELKVKGFQLKVIDKSAPNGVAIDVTGISPDGDGNIVFSIAGLNAPKNKTFRTKLFEGADAATLNRVWTVKTNNGTQVTVNFPFAALVNPNDLVLGKAVARVFIYVDIDNAELLRPQARQTGRAFFVSRGRH